MTRTRGTMDRSPLVRVSGGRTADPDAVLAAARAVEGADVAAVGPTGVEALAPLVTATLDGRTALFGDCDPDLAAAVASDLAGGRLRTGAADHVVEHDPGIDAFPTPGEGPLSVGDRTLLGPCGWVAPTAVEDVAPLAVETVDGSRVRDRIAALGLLGRGRADARTDRPVADAWTTARETPGDPVVVVNAHEAGPRSYADGLLVESAPVTVLDGALAVAAAVDATDVVAFLDESDDRAIDRVRSAIERLEAAGRFRGIGCQAVAGPDRYVAGEPTVALEAMEGADRIEARRSPPGPASYGLFGRPTAVHTPRTLAAVRAALLERGPYSPDAQSGDGRADGDDSGDPSASQTDSSVDSTNGSADPADPPPDPAGGSTDPADSSADPGTRIVRVAGDVDHPATVELPTDGSLATALEAVDVDGSFKMACVGGRFGGLTESLAVPPSAPALSAANLGTDGLIEVYHDRRCPVKTAGIRARFASEDNCGRCVPCREGTEQLTDMLRDVYDGEYAPGKLRELARTVRASSLCGFGQAAARPVTTAMDSFEAEFRAHADGRCPSGACPGGER